MYTIYNRNERNSCKLIPIPYTNKIQVCMYKYAMICTISIYRNKSVLNFFELIYVNKKRKKKHLLYKIAIDPFSSATKKNTNMITI